MEQLVLIETDALPLSHTATPPRVSAFHQTYNFDTLGDKD